MKRLVGGLLVVLMLLGCQSQEIRRGTFLGSESELSTKETRGIIEVKVLKPTILCDVSSKHEELPLLDDTISTEEYILKVLDSYEKESIRYQSVLDCLSRLREENIIN